MCTYVLLYGSAVTHLDLVPLLFEFYIFIKMAITSRQDKLKDFVSVVSPTVMKLAL